MSTADDGRSAAPITDPAPTPSSLVDIDISAFQDIYDRNINPLRLLRLLREKHGAGNYEIYRIHEVYSIRAPEQLSKHDIELCK
ncbi:hypothetical protein B0T24DRAFT_633249 [Lasiosphaeria ovina]|uniref:Uncharacterized protein n=1 Tax=Lasiosphaeria ovina TaxID=92902 RepID=A0AAE0K4A3_9PEZI|nr:hypothetical protein B0T24DRAFT_633249 [Lasiosphaeria ovina]